MNGFSNNLISFTRSVAHGIKEIKNLRLSTFRKVFSLMGRKEKIAILILSLAALTSLIISLSNFYISHTVPAPTTGGIYSEGLVGQPAYINPLLASQDPDSSLVKLVFSGLYKYGDKGQLIPDLADGMPQISEDQKQYTVNLKKNITWHNNKPLTADDVVFTIQTLKDPTYKSPLRALWESTNVEKISGTTVKFTTANISGPFVNNLVLPILPKSLWENVDAQKFLLSEFNLKAIGSGPYAIKEIKKLPSGKVEQITFTANTNFYLGRPKIDQVIIKFYDTDNDVLNAFHSREILGFGFTPLGSNLYLDKEQTQSTIFKTPLPQYQVVFFNITNKILSDQNVRQALTLTTDRQSIINSVFKNNANLPSSPLVFFNANAPKALDTSVDIQKAKTLLDAAGWIIDPKTGNRAKKGVELKISIATNDTLVNSQAAQILADQWKTLNIQVSLNILPSKQLMDGVLKPRNFDVLLFPQKYGADPDPFLFWHSSQVKNPGFNLTGFNDPKVDKIIVDARATTDHQKREAAYAQFNDLVLAKFPVIFLDQTEFIYALDNSVKNVNLKSLYDPSQRFYDIGNWYIKEKRVWKK